MISFRKKAPKQKTSFLCLLHIIKLSYRSQSIFKLDDNVRVVHSMVTFHQNRTPFISFFVDGRKLIRRLLSLIFAHCRIRNQKEKFIGKCEYNQSISKLLILNIVTFPFVSLKSIERKFIFWIIHNTCGDEHQNKNKNKNIRKL